MLQAFVAVRARTPGTVLLLVGRGALQAETEAMARALGLEGDVRFLGVRRDVPELMSAADGYVMSSAWEGMPMVLLEAGAAALPIVATAVGGNREVVRDGETGFVVPPREPSALADRMLRLMGLPEAERRAMGESGRRHVDGRYGLAQVADRWLAIYCEVLARKGRSGAAAPDGASAAQAPVESGAAGGAGASALAAGGTTGGQRNT
jgi:glycosyltransferase involved in cell wall biosynthesis